MRRDDAYVVRDEDVCATACVHEPRTGAPVYHERQVRDACASHAANALLGRHEVTVRDIEALRERRCAREHPGEGSVSGGGINFFELQELLAGRGEAISLHSLAHTRIVDGHVRPYGSVGDWAEANVDTVTALLAKQRFLINAPGHYVAVTRVVHGDVDPYALIDSTLPWQTLYPPRRLVAHLLAAEAARTRATSARVRMPKPMRMKWPAALSWSIFCRYRSNEADAAPPSAAPWLPPPAVAAAAAPGAALPVTPR